MAQRQFVDSTGVEWIVWSTVPSRAEFFADQFQGGWLTFDSGSERRRLAPLPPDWQDASVERLEQMCRTAEPTRQRTSPDSQPGVGDPGEP
jgi:hypothetical protein